MRRRHRRHQIGLCAYCGQSTEITIDHVVPQCLFGGHAPADTPTALACAACNHVRKSRDDTYFRNVLFTDLCTSLNPHARQLFNGQFLRAVGRNQSTFAHIVAQARPVEVVTPLV